VKQIAPYQIFFPLGLFSAISAVSIWFVKDLGLFLTPAFWIHSRLMMGGFLWSFITGFLMTAVPRMTGTASANRFEYVLALGCLVSQIIGAWILDGRWFYGSSMALTLFLVFYAGRRIVRSKKPIPIFFSHVGIAIVLAFLGALYDFRGDSYMALHLYYVGSVLVLILGLGTRFFSYLSGLPSDFESETRKSVRLSFHALGCLTALLLFLAGNGHSLAYLGLAVITTLYLFFVWKVQRPSARPSALKITVRVAALMIPGCFILCWLLPLMFITWFHFLFIGCFALMTLSVATRVTLAHGSYPIDLEMKSPALWWFAFWMALALISRTLYPFTSGLYQKSFLHLAATFWIFAILSWSLSYFIKILKSGSKDPSSC
jgi:uncharacterized protein involved in response to NO